MIQQGDSGSERHLRIAAIGDFHFDMTRAGSLKALFANAAAAADVLVLCGDFTTHGETEQTRGFVDELQGIDVPMVAVLGNHDHESNAAAAVTGVLRERGIHVLDGDNVVIEGVGFAGVKGFGGGFGRGMLGPFGEQEWKHLVETAMSEALKLESALRTLETKVKVAVMHYAPITATLVGEPEVIFPFLGSSRLLAPIETYGATVVFHGHAHTGAPEGRTPSGVPVFNVALPLLKQAGLSHRLWTVAVPDGGHS